MINITIDNQFRHPFRWGRCPINLKSFWVFGFKYYTLKENMRVKDRWVFVFYFGKKYKSWSNYPFID